MKKVSVAGFGAYPNTGEFVSDNIQKAIDCITTSTDFNSENTSVYDVSLFSKKMHQHIELHFSLIDDRFDNVTLPLENI